MQNILITGANGYIGHHVVKHLCNMCADDKIIATDFRNDNLDDRAEFLNVDIQQRQITKNCLISSAGLMFVFIWRGRMVLIINRMLIWQIYRRIFIFYAI